MVARVATHCDLFVQAFMFVLWDDAPSLEGPIPNLNTDVRTTQPLAHTPNPPSSHPYHPTTHSHTHNTPSSNPLYPPIHSHLNVHNQAITVPTIVFTSVEPVVA